MNTKSFLTVLANSTALDGELLDLLILQAEQMTEEQRDDIAALITASQEKAQKEKEEASDHLGNIKALLRTIRREKRNCEERQAAIPPHSTNAP